ncbi:hypothetical protein AKJ65_01630 [candidate division MSBL1 archaeon SCGC-AAA259E19]|uniref:SpoVT-AbrB domain-containing protein n=1 Tax=candidate division MSBL1 archaeon SCGC-AAA259E19 TaxID=1698264 RepID=A0A133UMY5_9EURY|nr:hypothetical protein AKJ65_01630 [candidate division MSBL1 archaeon SCGC-AAA259E19]
MALERKVEIKQSKNAHTQYLVIPSSVVQDSQYPFKADEEVKITVDPEMKRIIVERGEERGEEK